MKKTPRGSLGKRLFSGVHPGLPNPIQPGRTPFGQECRWKECFGISRQMCDVVVAVLAAESLGLGPVTKRQIEDVTGHRHLNTLRSLERGGWLVQAGQTPRSTEKLWAPTQRAWRTFFPQGWQVAA